MSRCPSAGYPAHDLLRSYPAQGHPRASEDDSGVFKFTEDKKRPVLKFLKNKPQNNTDKSLSQQGHLFAEYRRILPLDSKVHSAHDRLKRGRLHILQ